MSFPQDSVLIISWPKAFHGNWLQLEDFMFMFVLAKVGGVGKCIISKNHLNPQDNTPFSRVDQLRRPGEH